MSEPGAKPDLSVVELRILREHWEWGGRHTIFWIILTILIFGEPICSSTFSGRTRGHEFWPSFFSVPSFS
jgi:hypothetical protein